MKRITEDDIEILAVDLLKEQGFQHSFGPDVAPVGEQPFRKSYEEVLLSEKLREAIDRLNPDIPTSEYRRNKGGFFVKRGSIQ